MLYFFFFSSRRRHTRYWRDWSSDVCSSDLNNKSDIEKAVKNAAQNYNVNLNTGDINVIVNLLKEVGNQNYNYNDIKDTLNNVSANVVSKLKENGENINAEAVIDKATSWFENSKDANKFFNQFDDSKLSKDAVVSTTNDAASFAKEKIGQVADKAT